MYLKEYSCIASRNFARPGSIATLICRSCTGYCAERSRSTEFNCFLLCSSSDYWMLLSFIRGNVCRKLHICFTEKGHINNRFLYYRLQQDFKLAAGKFWRKCKIASIRIANLRTRISILKTYKRKKRVDCVEQTKRNNIVKLIVKTHTKYQENILFNLHYI